MDNLDTVFQYDSANLIGDSDNKNNVVTDTTENTDQNKETANRLPTYQEVFQNLSYYIAIVVFMKKDGSIRIMLCTRNTVAITNILGLRTSVLNGHDKRCNIQNGNISVLDLVIDEPRSFSINRLIDIIYFQPVMNKEQFQGIVNYYVDFKQKYESTMPKTMDLDTF